MPGIVGLITKMPRERAEMELRQMVEALRHEPSYIAGTWFDERVGVYVGWVERKGAFAERMPLYNQQGDLVLVFSGEEMPESGVKSRLKEPGHSMNGGGASYLVDLIEEGARSLRGLNGRFHGLLVNRNTGTATLFNDRYGLHRIYYYDAKNTFYFAAEAKAILAVRPEVRAIDPRSLGEFITCGCTLENRTLFRDIHVLPTASAWTFRYAMPEERKAYFDPKEWEEQSILETEPYYKQLREVFSKRLSRYFSTRGQEKVGISLTGGLDSRMIMSWHKAEPGSLPCYSFGGMFRTCQDVAIAQEVARICKQPHQIIPVDEQFLRQFPYYSERTVFLTDGCVEVKHSPDLYVNQIAACIAPIRMTGNYGGEVLRRVRAFKPVAPVTGLYHPELTPQFQCAIKTYAGLLGGHPLSFAVFRQAPWHHYGLLCLEQSQLSLRSPFLDNEFVETVFRAPQSSVVSSDISLRLIEDGCPPLRRLRTDRGVGGSLARTPASVRRKYLEFTFKAEYAYDYGMPQSLARIDHALSQLRLERLFLGRHKFYHFRIWYRDALAKYVQEMLLDSRTLSRPYLQRKTVEHIVSSHLRGNRNYTSSIHKLLTLEHLHRLFLDSR